MHQENSYILVYTGIAQYTLWHTITTHHVLWHLNFVLHHIFLMIEHQYNYLPCMCHKVRQQKVNKSHFWPCTRENMYILVCTSISWYISWHTVTQHPLLWIKPYQPCDADGSLPHAVSVPCLQSPAWLQSVSRSALPGEACRVRIATSTS